jgi:hypothetical protein
MVDRPRADEQLRGDIPVRQALADQPGDLQLLSGQRAAGSSGADGLAGGPQLRGRSFRPGERAERGERLTRGSQPGAGVDPATGAARVLTEQQLGPRRLQRAPGVAMPARRRREQLLGLVFAAHVERVVDAVPLTADNLPGYATRLYDAYLEHPEIVRLSTWARLERTPSGHLFDEAAEAGKLAAIATAQRDGYLRPDLEPVDIHSLVISMSMTWSPASTLIAADKAESPASHARRKQALATSVASAFCTRTPKR